MQKKGSALYHFMRASKDEMQKETLIAFAKCKLIHANKRLHSSFQALSFPWKRVSIIELDLYFLKSNSVKNVQKTTSASETLLSLFAMKACWNIKTYFGLPVPPFDDFLRYL